MFSLDFQYPIWYKSTNLIQRLNFHAGTLINTRDIPLMHTLYAFVIRNKVQYFTLPFCSDAANNSTTPPLLDYTEFYNSALDHMDLMQDYFNWQSPQHPGQFSYCQYPFILSIVAKRIILTKVTVHPINTKQIGNRTVHKSSCRHTLNKW